jgi:peptidoglycan/LPS O-acetylase OafA/YrhL
MKVYFSGLNGLRFFAASLVVFAHIEGFKKKAGIFSLHKLGWASNFINDAGSHGVKIFFTLSGFLITYLLLVEMKEHKNIDIGKFYIRRILRIWPLYFFIILLGFVIMPHVLNPLYFPVKTHPDCITKLLLNVFFLPNAVFFIYGHVFTLGILWSIGTEEQFYIGWPHIIRYGFKRNLVKVLLLSLGIVVMIKLTLFLSRNLFEPNWQERYIQFSYVFLQFDAMIIGSLFATLYYYNNTIMPFLYKKTVQFVVIAVTSVLVLLIGDFGVFSNLIFATLYGVIILNVATNPNTILRFRGEGYEFFGQVSFGIYMYHSIFIALSIQLLKRFEASFFLYNILLYAMSFGLTIGASIISYYFFERKILKYKNAFMVVKSGKII